MTILSEIGAGQTVKAEATGDKEKMTGGLFRTLSGRFIMLMVIFVLVAEVLVFVPAVARYRADYLLQRLKQAQIAALTQLASDTGVSPALERELLANAEVYNVVLRRDDIRQLVLSSPVPAPVSADYDLRLAGPVQLIRDAFATLLRPENQIIRVIGNPVQEGGQLIEVTMQSQPLRDAMLGYGGRLLALSAAVTAVIALTLFLAVQRLIVAPIRRVIRQMQNYAEAPEDARRLIVPHGAVTEIHDAEEALATVQRRLTNALRQKERLAQLGGAVAKISHDLRNILTTAQLFADRMENSKDPTVARSAPKLINSISRAISLCESTLTFGKAEEVPPKLAHFPLAPLLGEVAEGEGLADEGNVTCLIDVAPELSVYADREQLYRVFSNLLRNARQAIIATGQAGTIEISAVTEGPGWTIRVGDTGPGLPAKARDNLFAAFQGGARAGGTGLGLAIALELVRGHGGRLELLRTDSEGTEFAIYLPKEADATALA